MTTTKRLTDFTDYLQSIRVNLVQKSLSEKNPITIANYGCQIGLIIAAQCDISSLVTLMEGDEENN